MCKQDIEIKRRTATRTVNVTCDIGTLTNVFPPNPSRVGLIVGLVGGPANAGGTIASVLSGHASTDPAILAVSSSHPCDRTTIEETGLLITGEISVLGWDANVPVVSVTEVYFYLDLSEV